VGCQCCLVVDGGIRAYVMPFFTHELEERNVSEGGTVSLIARVEAYPAVGVLWYGHTQKHHACRLPYLPTLPTYLPIYLTYIISSQPASQPNKQTNTGHCLRHLNERRRSGNLNGTNPFSSFVIPTQK
jgi:hypothetical protein